MTIDSVLNAGFSGMRSSQRKMTEAAEQIAGAGTVTASGPGSTMAPAPSQPATAVSDANKPQSLRSQNIVEPLIELQRQEHVFTASAKLVSTADKILGSLIDVST